MMENFFSGEDRIEMSQTFGRPVRKGSPDALAVSDYRRVKETLNRQDAEGAMQRLSIMHPVYAGVISTFVEWGIALPSVLAGLGHADLENKITDESLREWENGVSSYYRDDEAIAVIKSLVAGIDANAIEAFRTDQAIAQKALEKPVATYNLLIQAIGQNAFTEAKNIFDDYFNQMRTRHDLAAEFVSTYTGKISQVIDQDTAFRTMQESLESCAMLKGMWQAFGALPPDALASGLAEHLRAHYSGPGREGSVRIIEDDDKFRLIMQPCGTGGAVRERGLPGNRIFSSPAPETWNLAEVSPYCAHCAGDELTSIRKFGFPIFVTDYTHDPKQPCAWTIYKDKSMIPEQYFTRLGKTKS